MKNFILILFLGLIASCSEAQKPEATTQKAEATTQKTEAAAQKSEYTAGNPGWMVDLDEAYAASKKSGKPIMANFTGSDWCGWCKRLTAAVFSKPEFQKWAKDNVILLELDFPRRTQIPDKYRRQNAQLQSAFKITGYPTVWVFNLDKDDAGKYQIDALGKTGYAPSVDQFTSAVDAFLR